MARRTGGADMTITYQREQIDAAAFASILKRSGLDTRRPAEDLSRLQRMLDGASLVVTARDDDVGEIVGVARSLTDWAYACYLSDLAVDVSYQRQGVGRRLIDMTRQLAGEESMCLLVSSPEASGFYRSIGMPETDRAFLYPRQR